MNGQMKKYTSLGFALLSFAVLFFALMLSATASRSVEGFAARTLLRMLLTVGTYLLSLGILARLQRTVGGEQGNILRRTMPRKILYSLLTYGGIVLLALAARAASGGADGFILEESGLAACVLTVFVYAVVPAVFEELYFRALLGSVLRCGGIREDISILISSLLFCLLHTGSAASAVFAFLSGILLCLLYRGTGSVIFSVGVHLAYNLTAIIIALLAG